MLQKLFVIIPYGGLIGMDFYVNLQNMVNSLKYRIVCCRLSLSSLLPLVR